MKDQPLRVLIVEDSEDDTLLVLRALKKGGYNPLYERVETDAAMKKALKEKQWDIILCDYKMVTFRGPSAIALLKETNIDIPLIIVSGAVDETMAVECMRLGAKDYVLKTNLSRLYPAIARELEDVEVRKKQRQTEGKLRAEEQRFKALVDHSSDIIVVLDTEATVIYVNPALEQVLGFKPEERIGKKGFELVHPDDINLLAEYFITLISDTNFPVIHWEMRLRHKNGNWRTLEAIGSNRIKNNIVEAVIVNYRDITERKRAKEALQESEARYRLISENTADLISILDMNLHFTYVSPASMRLRGFTVEEAMEQTLEQVLTPESMRLGLSVFEEEMELEARGTADPDRMRILELEEYKKDGSIIWMEVSLTFLRDKDNKPIEILMVSRDITARKQADKKLREKEEQYRRLVDQSLMGFGISKGNKVIFANSALLHIFGYDTLEEFVKIPLLDHVAPSFREMIAALAIKMNPEKESKTNFEYDILRKDGETRTLHGYATHFTSGDDSYTQTTFEDITDRKQAEDALKNSEEKYRTILEGIQEGYFEVDLAGNFTFVNDSLCRFLGYSKEELMGMNNRQYTDIEHSNKLFQAFNKVYNTGEPTEGFDWQIIRKDGTKRYVEASVSLQKDSSDKPIGFRGIVRDVTDRKQAEEALRESENRLRAQYNGNPIPTFTWQKQGDEFILTDFNDSAKIFTIGQKKSFLGRQASEMYKSRQEILPNIHRCFDEKRIIRIESLSEHFMPGKFVVITFVFVPPDLVMVHMEDITERKKAEEALKNSEAKYRNIFENAIEGIYQSTIEGRFITANAALARMAGYESPEELIESIKDIGTQLYVYPEDRKRFMEIREAKGFVDGFEVEFYKKDGSKFWVVVNARTVKDEQSKILYIEGLIEDITVRKHAEEQLHQTIDSLKKAVGTTIHVLGTASEARDPYTAGHQKRVADLARTIATDMKIPHDTIEGIRMAGSIHDIGKLSIPAEILSKPTKLTNTEFSLIKEHAQNGYEMLKDVESPWPLAEIVYQHHERVNGSGYPRNLKGDEILMEPQILAVADVVEAMASHRPYRPTLGIDAALEEIEKNKGILYDNTVADTCLRLFREKGYQLA